MCPLCFRDVNLLRSSALDLQLVGCCGLRRRQACREDAERRAGNVVQSYSVAELYR